MIQEYILDSNILIYLSKGDQKIEKKLNALRREYFFISTVSIVEVLIGEKDKAEAERLRQMVHQFVPLDLRNEIAEKAVALAHKSKKKLKFKDLLIAATALVEGLTLVTADKDFKSIPGLKLKLLSL